MGCGCGKKGLRVSSPTVPSVLARCTNCTSALVTAAGMTVPVHLVEVLVSTYDVQIWEQQGYVFEKRIP